MIRPRRLLAIARRDLAQELRGRRGLLFGAVTALLLIPVATLRMDIPSPGERPRRAVWVTGDVPEEVAALDNVRIGDRGTIRFRREPDGTLVARTQNLPDEVREALDGPEPEVVVTGNQGESDVPGRSILFALISASVLTGSVSESIGGERSRRTLQALLTASITRGEVVLGKWLAWAGYGGGAGLAAALLALALGRVEPGWWLLPLPTVAGGVVALAMYLSRHARDVVGGATVSLRYLPAVLAFTGLVAWYFGDKNIWLGASLPIGGALIASGGTWTGIGPILLATASTLAFTGLALFLTARDLEKAPPPPDSTWRRALEALGVAGLAAACWWPPLAAPLLWGAAGNPRITEGLPREPGVWAGAVALLLISLVRSGKTAEPVRELGLRQAPAVSWALALGVGGVLAVTGALAGLLPAPATPLLAAAAERIAAGLHPTWVGPLGFLLAVVAQELLFRGWLQRMVGPFWATAAFVAVIGPFEPIQAVVAGGLLAALTHTARGSVLPAIAARLIHAGVVAVAPAASLASALAIGTVGLAGLVLVARYRTGDPHPGSER